MKFTDGFWLVKKGLKAYHPAEAYDAEDREGTLVVHAPVKKVVTRGDVLNSPLLTVEVSAPMRDVLKVRVTHFAGARDDGPHFMLDGPDTGSPFRGTVNVTDEAASIQSGALEARFRRGDGPWALEFFGDGKPLTASESKGMGYIETDSGKTYLHEQLSLGVGETVYGLGERFSAFAKNGQSVDIWNEDGGTASEQTYKNIPFYLTNRGYGVFVNHTEKVSFEVASEKVSRVQFSVEGEYIEYFVFYGPDPKSVLTKYTGLTGRASLPPAWSFGLWLTTSFTTSYDEATCTKFIEGMAERNLPLSVFHFDCFWMREFNWCDFIWDKRTFPDPKGMLARLKAKGLKICVWINPYIAQRSVLFEEGMNNGFLVKTKDGGVWQWDLWQAGMGLVDFTNPAASAWFSAKLEALLDMGVDCFKTDFGERIPVDVVWHDGSNPERMHNFYTYLYNECVFDLLKRKRGAGDAVLFARSATAGGQKFPVHWGGDCNSTFPSMAESLRGGLSLGLSGFGFWSHDIGGFEGTPPAELFMRWIAFGIFSSHSRLHGSSSYRVPWIYGDEAVEVLRRFTHLKMRLMPYIFAAAVEATKTGVPVMRAMLLEFPDDPTTAWLDRQYMFGPDLLVAPVFDPEGRVEYYLPAGTWTHLLTGESRTGPAWFRETYGTKSLPLFARPGALVPFGNRDEKSDYDWTAGLTVEAFGFDNPENDTPSVRTIYDSRGSEAGSVILRRKGGTIEIAVTGKLDCKAVKVRLAGIRSGTVSGGTADTGDKWLLVRLAQDRTTVTIP